VAAARGLEGGRKVDHVASIPRPGGKSAVLSGSAVKDPQGGGNVTIQTSLTPENQSVDANQGGVAVPGEPPRDSRRLQMLRG